MRTVAQLRGWIVAVAALAAWAALSPSAAADPCLPCYGLPVGSVRFEGVDPEAGIPGKIALRLLSLTDLEQPGAVFSPELRARTEERLARSGFFLETFILCDAREGEAHVTISAIPNSWVEKVEVEGTEFFYASELEKRLFIRPGQVLNPAVEEDADRLRRQVEVLLSYMRKQGFDNATVEPLLTPRPPNNLRIKFQVSEGEVSRISRVRVRLDQPEHVKGEPEHSCPHLSSRVLRRVAKVRSGSPYTRAQARQTRKELREWLQMYGFIAPKVTVEYDPERETLTAQVKVDQCFSVVFLERVSDAPEEGTDSFRKVNNADLYQALPFRESGSFDRTEAGLGIDEVQVYYQTRGHLFARVDMQYADYRTGREDWPWPMVGAVRYMITLGEPAEIRKISIDGAAAVPEKALLQVMETVPYDFFGEGGYLQVEQLIGDLGRLKNEYRDRGFPRMSFPDAPGDPELRVAVRREGDSTIYAYTMGSRAFEVVKHDWESPIYIRIRVDEGEPSRVGTMTVDGVEALLLADLQKSWALKDGGLYSGSRLRRAVEDLRKRYLAAGYHKVRIEVSCVGRDPEVEAAACDPDRVTSQEVDLTIRVTENDRSVMGEVLWHGLRRSHPSVIRRDFPKPGAPFDKDKIDEAVRRIRNLGTFASVRAEYIGLDETPPRDRVAVVIYVEEVVNRFLEFSAGFQTMPPRGDAGQRKMNNLVNSLISASIQATGSVLTGGARSSGDSDGPMIRLPDLLIMAELSYTDRNFVGRAKELTLPVKYGFSTTSFLRYASFLPTYRDRRLFGTDLILRLTPLIEFDHALRDLDIFEYGLDTELSYLIMKRIFLSLGSKVSRISWKNPEEVKLGPPEIQFEVSPTARFDWRNSPTNPTKGLYFGTRLTYINALNEEGARDNFVKLDLSFQGYLSFRRVLTIAVMGRVGTSWSVAGDRLPENHRFRLGGTSGVRGFPAGGVAQYEPTGLPRAEVAELDDSGNPIYEMTRDGDSVVNGTVELRFPILRKQDFYGTLFVDFGGLSESIGDLHGNSLRFSVGTGVRYLVGGQFPLRLDYGFVLDRRCASVDPETGEFTGCEKENIGALDFGLLYTF